ncbi:MAG TPA: NAD-dependent epimerase/dehydratase family protein, partial [Anaerolineales bacterium]|nr:NAD-dependent epimerase/dehydratase family protein [Anaerolineales bacterium]
MNILVIGGTRFLGRHFVNSARAYGHEVTLFNRGKTNPTLYRRVKTIVGDRERDLDQLSGRWDAVVDTCGYIPRMVKRSAE